MSLAILLNHRVWNSVFKRYMGEWHNSRNHPQKSQDGKLLENNDINMTIPESQRNSG